MTDNFKKLLELVEQEYGPNSIYQPSKFIPTSRISRFSTGNLDLDINLGGGIPRGRIILVSGPESSGKTFFVKKCFAELTKLGERVALMDEERENDPEWDRACGVDPDLLWVGNGDYAEKTLDMMEVLVGSGEFGAVALDSVAALIPKKLREESTEDANMGREAKLMSLFLRKILAAQDDIARTGKTPPTVFLTNQQRLKIGMVYGNPVTIPGGEAQKYYNSIWLEFKAKEQILDKSDQIIGLTSAYNTRKNKTAPRRSGEFSLYVTDYKGMKKGEWDSTSAVMDAAVRFGVLEQVGKRYESSLFQKSYYFSQVWAMLRNDPSLEGKFVDAVKKCISHINIAYENRRVSVDAVEVPEDKSEEEKEEFVPVPKKKKSGKNS